jgi:hypothetical protein
MINSSPIPSPPPELVQEWINEENGIFAEHIATRAARWGADQELEACVEWLERNNKLCPWATIDIDELHDARRPKLPSLKEQALALVSHDFSNQPCLSEEGYALIRRALEALPND